MRARDLNACRNALAVESHGKRQRRRSGQIVYANGARAHVDGIVVKSLHGFSVELLGRADDGGQPRSEYRAELRAKAQSRFVCRAQLPVREGCRPEDALTESLAIFFGMPHEVIAMVLIGVIHHQHCAGLQRGPETIDLDRFDLCTEIRQHA